MRRGRARAGFGDVPGDEVAGRERSNESARRCVGRSGPGDDAPDASSAREKCTIVKISKYLPASRVSQKQPRIQPDRIRRAERASRVIRVIRVSPPPSSVVVVVSSVRVPPPPSVRRNHPFSLTPPARWARRARGVSRRVRRRRARRATRPRDVRPSPSSSSFERSSLRSSSRETSAGRAKVGFLRSHAAESRAPILARPRSARLASRTSTNAREHGTTNESRALAETSSRTRSRRSRASCWSARMRAAPMTGATRGDGGVRGRARRVRWRARWRGEVELAEGPAAAIDSTRARRRGRRRARVARDGAFGADVEEGALPGPTRERSRRAAASRLPAAKERSASRCRQRAA